MFDYCYYKTFIIPHLYLYNSNDQEIKINNNLIPEKDYKKMFRCEKRNNKLYLYTSSFDFFNPQMIVSYWKINNITDLNNFIPEKFVNTYIYKLNDKIIPLYIDNVPEFTEIIPVKLKKSEKWYNGEIVKK